MKIEIDFSEPEEYEGCFLTNIEIVINGRIYNIHYSPPIAFQASFIADSGFALV